MKIKCYCIICEQYLGEFNPSYLPKVHNGECKRKLASINATGIKNPNYRHGKNIENRCKDCNKIIDARAERCCRCRAITDNPFKGKEHSEDTRRIIGEKSKAKFTPDFIQKVYRDKRQGKKKRAINGYILVKDYNNPNRDSHNDILEHKLVMSNYLGRLILNGEIIHHIDFNRQNNDISNLYLYKNRSEHTKMHGNVFKLISDLLKMKIIKFEDGNYKIIATSQVGG